MLQQIRPHGALRSTFQNFDGLSICRTKTDTDVYHFFRDSTRRAKSFYKWKRSMEVRNLPRTEAIIQLAGVQ
jgi:hypothetical protein